MYKDLAKKREAYNTRIRSLGRKNTDLVKSVVFYSSQGTSKLENGV